VAIGVGLRRCGGHRIVDDYHEMTVVPRVRSGLLSLDRCPSCTVSRVLRAIDQPLGRAQEFTAAVLAFLRKRNVGMEPSLNETKASQ
jgi:hypothetical protein